MSDAEPIHGWVDHSGKRRPVPKHALVELRFRGASPTERPFTAGFFDWVHRGYRSDIVAYRLHAPSKAQPETPA